MERKNMKILITGICGFVGHALAKALIDQIPGSHIEGIDNLIRPGSELNRNALKAFGIPVFHGDIRNTSDLETLKPADWIIDAAANPSVLAGIDGKTSSRQIIEHNLLGTINLLELCRKWSCGFIMLSTSRVYSIQALSGLKMDISENAFVPSAKSLQAPGMTPEGITEEFSTQPPLSFYGTSKLASEQLAQEYGAAFKIPFFINRCGVMAGAGQFGKADQGIFSYWLHAYRLRKPLTYIGFNGNGCQVRDCMHPLDLAALLTRQMNHPDKDVPSILNISGGTVNSMSLAQLSAWCAARFGAHNIGKQPKNRPFDIPWLILNSQRAQQAWDWSPQITLESILEEIARHAEQHPQWLDYSADD